MLSTNPFLILAETVSPIFMQSFVVVMIILVVAGTLLDVIHKKNAVLKIFTFNLIITIICHDFYIYFVSPENDRDIRAYSKQTKTLVIASATCVFSHAFKKEHRD